MRKTLENPANFFKKTKRLFFKQNKNNGKPVRKKLHLQNSGKEEKIDVPTFSPPSGPNHLL